VEYYEQGCSVYIGNFEDSLNNFCSTKKTRLSVNYTVTVNVNEKIPLANNNECNQGSGILTNYDYIRISILRENQVIGSKNISSKPDSFPIYGTIQTETSTGGSFQITISYLTEVTRNILVGDCTPTYSTVTSKSVSRTTEQSISLSVDLINK